jgi:hypothetical protein
MKLPAYDGYKSSFQFSVRGQEPNNFLLKAWKATAANHTAIRAPKVTIPSSISAP